MSILRTGSSTTRSHEAAPACEFERPTSPRTLRQRGFGYVWMSYSLLFFIDALERHNTVFWLQSLAIYAVFAVLYVAFAESRSRNLRLLVTALMFCLGVAVCDLSPGGAATFFIYTAAFLPFVFRSVPLLFGLLLALCGTVAAEGLIGVSWMQREWTIFFILVVGGGNISMALQKRADAKLRAAQEENAELAKVAERERIARDLHDVLGHTLSVIVLKTELAGRLMGIDDARAKAEIDEVERTARSALAEVREAIGGYRARGLAAEVESARRTLHSANVELSCESIPRDLGANEETVLSLAIREAVTNIVRHAHATRCTMRFEITGEGYRLLTVEDDGRNLNPREGNGLRGMRARVQALGGRLRIERQSGTRLVIELPSIERERI
jgi:two-component system sensor histidine kinase DesK